MLESQKTILRPASKNKQNIFIGDNHIGEVAMTVEYSTRLVNCSQRYTTFILRRQQSACSWQAFPVYSNVFE